MNDYPADPACCAASSHARAVPLRPYLTAGVLWLWLDHIIRHYGPDVPLCVGEQPLADVKLKTNGRDTHVVVFLPALEGEQHA